MVIFQPKLLKNFSTYTQKVAFTISDCIEKEIFPKDPKVAFVSPIFSRKN